MNATTAGVHAAGAGETRQAVPRRLASVEGYAALIGDQAVERL